LSIINTIFDMGCLISVVNHESKTWGPGGTLSFPPHDAATSTSLLTFSGCDTLDNILLNYRVNVIKIDVEGAEVLALKAAAKTLERIRKKVVEIHGNRSEDVIQVLGIHGFKVESVKERGQVSYII
ncbi:MAG: FkbM family methyltransferase, partial [Candidatus Nitrosopolaris sp.]